MNILIWFLHLSLLWKCCVVFFTFYIVSFLLYCVSVSIEYRTHKYMGLWSAFVDAIEHPVGNIFRIFSYVVIAALLYVIMGVFLFFGLIGINYFVKLIFYVVPHLYREIIATSAGISCIHYASGAIVMIMALNLLSIRTRPAKRFSVQLSLLLSEIANVREVMIGELLEKTMTLRQDDYSNGLRVQQRRIASLEVEIDTLELAVLNRPKRSFLFRRWRENLPVASHLVAHQLIDHGALKSTVERYTQLLESYSSFKASTKTLLIRLWKR